AAKAIERPALLHMTPSLSSLRTCAKVTLWSGRSCADSRYDRQKADAIRLRTPLAPRSHDGDCLTADGGRCVRWDSRLLDESLDRGHPLFDAYCGCVQKQCQWFTQPRPAIHLENRKSAAASSTTCSSCR